MLQVAEKSTGQKRKALLMAEVPPTDMAAQRAEGEDTYQQIHYSGEAFDRMRADPELARASQSLLYGVVSVVLMILLVTVFNLISGYWLGADESLDSELPEQVMTLPESPNPQNQVLPPMLSQPLDFEQMYKQRRVEAEMGPTPLGN